MLVTKTEELTGFYAEKRLWQGITSVEVTANGRIFAVFYSGGETECMGNFAAVVMSDDGGATFKGFLLLDGRGNVSYPDVKEADDGFLYIIYDHERGARYSKDVDYSTYEKAILMAKVTEADILAGDVPEICPARLQKDHRRGEKVQQEAPPPLLRLDLPHHP